MSQRTSSTPTRLGDLASQILERQCDPEIVARYEARQAEKRQREKIQAESKTEEDLAALYRMIGARYEPCRIANYRAVTPEQIRVRDFCREYCQDITSRVKAAWGVVWIGPVGTGKDHLMSAMMRAAVSAGLSVVWRNGVDLFADFRRAFDDDSKKGEAQIVSELAKPLVLAISDPITPQADGRLDQLTRYQIERLASVVDKRYRDNKPTWITINAASRQHCETLLTAPIVDRLWDNATVLECVWESNRKPRKG